MENRTYPEARSRFHRPRISPAVIPAILILLLGLAESAPAAGKTWHVRTDGSGDFTSIQSCVNAMSGGDICLVGAGSYQERIHFPGGKSGSSNTLTTLQAEVAGTVDFWGADTAGCKYLMIQGFNITSPPTASGWGDGVGLYVNSGNLEIIGNYLHDIHYPAISGSGNNVHVSGNHFFKCGIGINMSGTNWLVESNAIERVTKYPELGDADNIRFFGNNHVIRNNHFYGTLGSEIGTAHVDGFQTFDDGGDHAQHIVIEGNLLEGFYHEGFMLEATYYTNSYDLEIRNNIFISPQTYAVAATENYSDVRVYNNVVINPAIYGVYFLNNAHGVVKNNIFYSTAPASISTTDIQELTYSADGTSSVTGASNLLYFPNKTISHATFPNDLVNLNPLFVNLTNGDFHLQAGSPVVDRGVTIPTFNWDRDGVLRPQGAGWDIGPYELIQTPLPVRVYGSQIGPSQVVLQWGSVPGAVYRAEYQDGGVGASWTPVGNDLTATGTSLSVTNDSGGSPIRFFRVSQIGG